MVIFNEIEKLINEHGSAVILKERLLLASDQYFALEKKNADLVKIHQALLQKIATLESENLLLKTENSKMKDATEGDDKKGNRLPEEQEKILQFICQHEEAQEEVIIQNIGLNAQRVKFHLGELGNKYFINQTMTTQNMFGDFSPKKWFIAHNGREYLVKHNLL